MSFPLGYVPAMNSDINKYLALQAALINEKTKLEARLNEISKVLGQDVSAPAASPAPTAPTTTTAGKRTFSAATRAKMKASQQARWAKKKGKAGGKALADAAPAPKKAKRTMSEATKAKMRAAHQARWAKKKGPADATKVPAVVAATSTPAPKKKRKMSAAGRAAIVAAAKARWAKVKAAGKKTLAD